MDNRTDIMSYCKILFLILAPFFLGNCSPDKTEDKNTDGSSNEEMDEKYKKIIEKHNEVMPKIDDIQKTKGLLEKELDRIKKGVTTVNEERKKALEEIIEELNNADESMMVWMRHSAKKPSDSIPLEKAMEILQDSESEIMAVEKNINSTLEKANALLNPDESKPE